MEKSMIRVVEMKKSIVKEMDMSKTIKMKRKTGISITEILKFMVRVTGDGDNEEDNGDHKSDEEKKTEGHQFRRRGRKEEN